MVLPLRIDLAGGLAGLLHLHEGLAELRLDHLHRLVALLVVLGLMSN